MTDAPLLSLRDIHACYGKKPVLTGVSLDLFPGEVVAILGPNGAGKSTLLKVVAGLLIPYQGRVQLNGEDITSLSTEERAQSGIGFMMQGGRIFNELTVEENLRLAGVTPCPPLEWLPVADAAQKPAGLLSGGQRQRLAATMLRARAPKVALLDEPSAGVSTGNGLGEILAELKTRGAGVLLVEQNRELAIALADRQVTLSHGTDRNNTIDVT